MTLARSIINATNRAAQILRDARTHVDIEDAASIEHVCAVARQHLKPAPSSKIAARMLARDPTLAGLTAARADWLPGEEVRTTAGKNGTPELKAVPEEPKP